MESIYNFERASSPAHPVIFAFFVRITTAPPRALAPNFQNSREFSAHLLIVQWVPKPQVTNVVGAYFLQ
jgi:hypothetical protein